MPETPGTPNPGMNISSTSSPSPARTQMTTATLETIKSNMIFLFPPFHGTIVSYGAKIATNSAAKHTFPALKCQIIVSR